jgi:hypothetical protein
MADAWVRPPVPDAPFYALIDLRDESETLSRFWVTTVEPRTGKLREDFRGYYPPPLTAEELLYSEKLRQQRRTLGSAAFSIQREHFIWPNSLGAVETKRWAYGTKPRNITQHWDRINGAKSAEITGPDWYMFVSEAWKRTIEDHEPTPPAFFPFELEFVTPKRRDSHRGFVLRDRAFVRDHAPLDFKPTWNLGPHGLEGRWGFKDLENKLVEVTFPKHAVDGRHWFRVPQADAPWSLCPPFVSAQLVEALLPLMPDRVCLFPAYVH